MECKRKVPQASAMPNTFTGSLWPAAPVQARAPLCPWCSPGCPTEATRYTHFLRQRPSWWKQGYLWCPLLTSASRSSCSWLSLRTRFIWRTCSLRSRQGKSRMPWLSVTEGRWIIKLIVIRKYGRQCWTSWGPVVFSWEMIGTMLWSIWSRQLRELKSSIITLMKLDRRRLSRQELWTKRRFKLGKDIRITSSLTISEKEDLKQKWSGASMSLWKR